MGLINRACPEADFAALRDEMITQICANAPMSLQTSKFIIENPQAQHKEVAQRLGECLDSEDYAEGRRAFMEKRVPHFTGK